MIARILVLLLFASEAFAASPRFSLRADDPPSETPQLESGDGGAPLQIVREVLLPVTFSLLVRPGTDAAAVKTVATHPHADHIGELRDVMRAFKVKEVWDSGFTAKATKTYRRPSPRIASRLMANTGSRSTRGVKAF